MEWTDEQTSVIMSGAGERILVEAGPGTGKTAIACARVARLLVDDDLNPSSILMVSFTRTAVAEMKSRISQMADATRASAVNIATLDQTAFSFGIGCGQAFEQLMGSFEGNIENALNQLQSGNPLLIEYLHRIRHVILDEAQDLTGVRSKFATLLLTHLPTEAGVTVLADRAQAIYGFTTDLDDSGEMEQEFLKTFEFARLGYRCVELKKIHRTGNAQLLALFDETRKALFGPSINMKLVEAVITEIKKSGSAHGHDIKELPLKDGDLLLYRKRASALMASQFCPSSYRQRLPGYPSAVFPWVALVFWNWCEPAMGEVEFGRRWAAQVPPAFQNGFDVSSAWNLLTRLAIDRRKHLDVTRLRTLVARPRPPVELCYLEYGSLGPTFSTIHASKGREADRVFLMLPRNLKYLESDSKFNVNAGEEARVYYVGATRVKKEFSHGVAQTMIGAGRLDDSGRRVVQIPFKLRDAPKFQFGLAGDLDEFLLITRLDCFCESEREAGRRMENLVSLWHETLLGGTCHEVSAITQQVTVDGEQRYYYTIMCNGHYIGWSGTSLMKDLWSAAKKTSSKTGRANLRPPDLIPRLRLIGLRTCAVPDNPAIQGTLHEPFATSGFFLAPMVVGFPSFYFKFYRPRY